MTVDENKTKITKTTDDSSRYSYILLLFPHLCFSLCMRKEINGNKVNENKLSVIINKYIKIVQRMHNVWSFWTRSTNFHSWRFNFS